MIAVELSEKLREKLKRESEKRGIPEDEIILEALSKFLELDPKEKAEMHLSLSEKYLKEAEEFLEKKDFIQASEKAWGAASQIVKAVAAKRGIELRSHGELHKFISKLKEETKDEEIRKLWQVAISLHQNFYENWLPEEIVRESIGDVKRLVEKLKIYEM